MQSSQRESTNGRASRQYGSDIPDMFTAGIVFTVGDFGRLRMSARSLVLPLRWNAIRAQFHEQLQTRLRAELEMHYHQLLTDVTNEVLAERRQNENFLKEIAEVSNWLAEREQAASIVNLYGK